MGNAVAEVGAAHVEVAIDNGRYRKPAMPIFSPFCATPEGEAGDTGNVDEIVAQGEVAGEDEGALLSHFSQPFFCVTAANGTPLLAGSEGIGVEQVFVVTDDIGFSSPRNGRCQRNMWRAKRVVVQGENGDDEKWLGAERPAHVLIFRGVDTIAAANGDQFVIAEQATGGIRIVGHCPQIVVARCPEQFGEFSGEVGHRYLEKLDTLAHVSGDDEPIFWVRGQIE